MGKKFKLSDMIPNAWFYKLKYMNITSKNTQSINSTMVKKHHHSPPPPPPPSSPPQPEPERRPRKSYHVPRELTIDLTKSPRKSKSSSKSRRNTRRSSSISSFSCQSSSTSISFGSKSHSPPSPPPHQETDVVSTNVGFLVDNIFKQNILDGNNVEHFDNYLVEDILLKNEADCSNPNKQNILDDRNALANDKVEHYDSYSLEDVLPGCPNPNKQNILDKNALADNKPEHFQLSPIITKKLTKEHKQKPHNSPPSRRISTSSPGRIRIKIKSPRFIGKKQGQNSHKNVGRKSTSSRKRRSISESFAIVKSSFDPQRDFKESMVEMIVQNNLTATKDLEDLLACYLSLNSDEYHDIIIMAFKQIWFDFRQR